MIGTMKKQKTAITLTISLLFPWVALAGADPPPIRVLFIGNSYTYVNDLPQMIADLAQAAKQRPLVFDKETPGGYSLEQHWKDAKAVKKIATGTWDFVVLQEQSLRPLNEPQLMFDYAAKFAGEIKKTNAKTLLYQTWARQDALERQPELSKAYLDLGTMLKADVVPVGMAWERARKDDPELVLHSADKSHPSKAGTYLAACVFYAVIYNKSPEGLPGKPGGLSDAEAMKLQTIAWETIHKGADIRLANGIQLHYETSGSGSIPVVLVHGYSMSSEVWKKVLPLFPPDYRCWAVDLRGFGRSDKPNSSYSCATMADDIAAFMDAMGISNAVLVGHSFGGFVLQHFAARYPARVTALVLANAFAASLPPKGLSPAVEQRINGYGTVAQSRAVFAAVMPRYFDTANVTTQDIERFIAIGLQAGNPALQQALQANYTTPAIPAAQLAAIQAPVLILVGTHDPFGTFDQAIAMSDALPNSRIQIITRCGHSPMWEKPTEFAGIVAEFISTSFGARR